MLTGAQLSYEERLKLAGVRKGARLQCLNCGTRINPGQMHGPAGRGNGKFYTVDGVQYCQPIRSPYPVVDCKDIPRNIGMLYHELRTRTPISSAKWDQLRAEGRGLKVRVRRRDQALLQRREWDDCDGLTGRWVDDEEGNEHFIPARRRKWHETNVGVPFEAPWDEVAS